MTGEALYEQYKDALKRGHVASLRGRLEDALLAYAEAARIAPERPTPHTSAGTAYLRRGRPADALQQFDIALGIAPRDEAALAGRAQALAALGRLGEAADAFDVLASAQAAARRLAEAVDAARRGLELAEGRERRRNLERLIARLRESEPDEPGRVALERAVRTLDGPAVAAVGPRPQSGPSTTPGPTPQDETTPSGAPGPDEAAAPDQATGDGLPGAGAVAHDEAAAPAGAALDGEPEPVPALPLSRVIPEGMTDAELTARAEAAAASADPGAAIDALLDLAAANLRDGRIDAAFDACYSALTFDPDSVPLHLALVDLYRERSWGGLATEKLDLLDRLARLDGDDAALAAVAGRRVAGG